MDSRNSSRRRFISGLLDHADKNRGAFPKTRSLSGYTEQEAQDILIALQRRHWRRGPNGSVVKVGEYIQDTYGSPERFRNAMCNALGRKPIDRQQEQREITEALLEAAPRPSDGPADVRSLIKKQQGWVGRSLRRDGPELTCERLRAYTSLIGHLQEDQDGKALRQVVAEATTNSHLLDDDALLRSGIDAYVRARAPVAEDLDAAYEALGVLRRVQNPGVTWQGPLRFRFPHGEMDFTDLAKQRLPASLPEATLNAARSVQSPEWVLYVENPSTWEALRRYIPTKAAIVLTDGMPNHATRALCRLLDAAGPRQFHWGDIDAGGLRVLACLQACGAVEPVLMDTQTLLRHREHLTELSDAKRDHLQKHRDVRVLQACLDAGGFLEQERVPVHEVIEELVARLPEPQA